MSVIISLEQKSMVAMGHMWRSTTQSKMTYFSDHNILRLFTFVFNRYITVLI